MIFKVCIWPTGNNETRRFKYSLIFRLIFNIYREKKNKAININKRGPEGGGGINSCLIYWIIMRCQFWIKLFVINEDRVPLFNLSWHLFRLELVYAAFIVNLPYLYKIKYLTERFKKHETFKTYLLQNRREQAIIKGKDSKRRTTLQDRTEQDTISGLHGAGQYLNNA